MSVPLSINYDAEPTPFNLRPGSINLAVNMRTMSQAKSDSISNDKRQGTNLTPTVSLILLILTILLHFNSKG